jgi:hypothetical protein
MNDRSKKTFSLFGKGKPHKPKDEDEKLPLSIPLYRTNTDNAVHVHGSGPNVFLDQSYQMLTHNLPVTPHLKLSCRGGGRESILVNLDSPDLKKIFDEFIQEFKSMNEECEPTWPLDEDTGLIDKTKSEKETKSTPVKFVLPPPFDVNILQALVDFVHSRIRNSSDAVVWNFMKEEHAALSLQKVDNVAMLEWFWKHKAGNCRHHALAVIYLLVTLIDYHAQQNGKSFAQTKSQVYRFRTSLKPLVESKKPASHAVVIYEAENGHRYLLDATRTSSSNKPIVVNLSQLNRAERAVFKNDRYYDSDAFLDEIAKVYDALKNKVSAERTEGVVVIKKSLSKS